MIVSAGWIVPAVLGAVNQAAQRRLAGEPSAPAGELLFAGGDWLLYAFLTPAVFAVARRWPLSRPHVALHGVVHLAASLVFCAAWAAAGTVLRAAVAPQTLYYPLGRSFVSWLFITFPFGVAVYLSMVGIEHAVRYFDTAREKALEVSRLSEQLSAARFAALQAQLNPHFLFNALNTIAVLVRDDDRPAAVAVVEHLADVLRATVTGHRANEVTLGQELELVRGYLAIEQARFSDRLRATIDAAPDVLGAAVPSFALQHLVENAVRHGIARRLEAGRLDVAARRDGDTLALTVADDGPGIAEGTAEPHGHGLDTTRERLRGLYSGLASLTLVRRSDGGTQATLRVPYHEVALPRDDDAR